MIRKSKEFFVCDGLFFSLHSEIFANRFCFINSNPVTLKTDVINLVAGFNDDIKDGMINLLSMEFLCNLGIQYILGKTLLALLTLTLSSKCFVQTLNVL